MGRISKKPSRAISQALDDLRKVERSSKYEVDMDIWHGGRDLDDEFGDRKCTVCLAGAVMAKTLKKPMDQDVVPENFNKEVRKQLIGLNQFRIGLVTSGLRSFGIKKPTSTLDRDIEDYDIDRRQFYRDLRKLAIDLKKAGH